MKLRLRSTFSSVTRVLCAKPQGFCAWKNTTAVSLGSRGRPRSQARCAAEPDSPRCRACRCRRRRRAKRCPDRAPRRRGRAPRRPARVRSDAGSWPAWRRRGAPPRRTSRAPRRRNSRTRRVQPSRPCQRFELRRGDAEQVEHAAHAVRDEIVDRLRPDIERGHRREDDAAHLRDRHHVAQVREVERRLAHQQHQAPALLQRDIGRARNEVVGMRVRRRRQRLHRAGRDHHPLGEEGAACDRRGDVARVVGDAGEPFHVLALHAQLVPAVERARLRQHQMAFPAARGAQFAQQLRPRRPRRLRR